MIRALLLSPTAVPGGAETALLNLARFLPRHGVEVRAVLLQDGAFRHALEQAGVPVTLLPAGRTRHLLTTAKVVRGLAHLAREADVVISNQSKGHVYGGVAARMAGRPAIWWQHGIPSRRSAIERVAASVPAAAVVCGGRDAEQAQRQLTPRRQVRLIPPGLDLEEIQARRGEGARIRQQLGCVDQPVVGIVGRLQSGKGQDIFLRAAAAVASSRPDVRFLVVGGAVLGWEGDYPQRLERLADELGIRERVHFAGHQTDVYRWFDAMDVVVHASLGESFGLVLVEAMALGRPLIAAAAGGPSEIVEDGKSGLLVPPGQADELAVAVLRVLSEADLASALAAAAVARADHFSADRMSLGFVDLLASLSPPG